MYLINNNIINNSIDTDTEYQILMISYYVRLINVYINRTYFGD